MKEKKIAVVGVGGKTGTMFAFELGRVSDILGIGKEITKIQKKKLFVERKKGYPEVFERKVILDLQFPPPQFLPEIIFLATKNPVGPVVKYYYQKIRKYNSSCFPTLVLSQNGIVAGEEAISTLKGVFGPDYKKIRVIRLVLLNPVNRKEIGDKTYIAYSLPIRVGFGKISGPGNLQDIAALFKEANFQIREFPSEEVKNMEFSKLFLNLIGMASATRGFSIKQGFQKPEIFKEEMESLKEYIKIVRASGGKFTDLFNHPVRLLTFLFNVLPTSIFLLLKNYFAKLAGKGREGKAKDLSEIEYYNGAVVSLGRKLGIATPINQRILERWTELVKAQAPKA